MSSTHRYTAQRTSSSASSQQDSNVRSSAFVQVGAPSDTFNSCRMDSGIAWAGAWAGGGSSRILSSPVERRAKVERLDAASLPVEIRANIERLNAPSPSGKMPTQPRIYTTSPEPDALSSLPDWYNHHPRTTELGQAISSAGPSSTYSMSTEYRARQPIETASYRCTVEGCGKSFSRGYSLTAHMETHDEERVFPFPCQEPNCPKKFVRKTDLQRHHQSVHTMERNHMCDFCGRLFGRADTRRRSVVYKFFTLSKSILISVNITGLT